MSADELVWQSREITGTTTDACEQCGRPMEPGHMQYADDETTADGGTGMRICSDCHEAIGRGTEPVELDDDADDIELVL